MGDLSNINIGWRSALMFAVCLPMIVVAVMLATRRVERAANIFLAGFLLIAVIAQVPQILGFAGGVNEEARLCAVIGSPGSSIQSLPWRIRLFILEKQKGRI